MNRTSVLLALFGALSCSVSACAETSLDATRSTLEKWVETKQLISKTKADWQTDKETIEQTLQLFDRELKTVEEQMSKLSTNNTQVEKERVIAEAQLNASSESLDRAKQFAATFEDKMAKFAPQLPMPLQDILKPLLAKLPADSADTKMASTERIQVIVGILNEVDKFNNAVNLFSEKRKNEKGEEVAVETVYVGLGVAYFVNDADNFAGMGIPGANGWEWTIKSDLAEPVRKIVKIYRNEHPAHFVALPASIR
jgi:septal ring factor EnvC (AmiA/AmiB activator)